MEYSERAIDKELDELLPELPAIALDGPKGWARPRPVDDGAPAHSFLLIGNSAPLAKGPGHTGENARSTCWSKDVAVRWWGSR